MKKIWLILPAAVTVLFLGGWGYRLFFSDEATSTGRPPAETIICFGDSLTAGYGASEGMDYPSQLSRMLGRPVVNAGRNGDTTATALARLERDVLSQSPTMVLITIGGNDLKNGVAAATAFANLKRMIEAIQSRGALVIVGGIDIPLYGRGFGKGFERVAAETGAVLIPNILADIYGHGRMMSDPIHPNDAGYTLIARKFYETVTTAIR